MNYPNIDQLSRDGWSLSVTTMRYGCATIAMMVPQGDSLLGETLDTLSDGDDDACYMGYFLQDIEPWFPILQHKDFHSTLRFLDEKIGFFFAQDGGEFSGARMSQVNKVLNHLSWWQAIRYEAHQRIGEGPKTVDEVWDSKFF